MPVWQARPPPRSVILCRIKLLGQTVPILYPNEKNNKTHNLWSFWQQIIWFCIDPFKGLNTALKSRLRDHKVSSTGLVFMTPVSGGPTRLNADTVILVNLILVKLSSFFVITFHRGIITACKFDRILPLDTLYLPIPIRTRNEGVRPWFINPEVFSKQI